MKKIAFLGIAVLLAAIIFGIVACGDSGATYEAPDIEMVNIPLGGAPGPHPFMMGSPDDEPDRSTLRERPPFEVRVTGFRMGKYLITQEQYRMVARSIKGKNPNPSYWQSGNPLLPSNVNADKLPVEQVSWYDAVEFCNRLSELQGVIPGYIIKKDAIDPNNLNTDRRDPKWTVELRPGSNGYRLPTEAQWEFACRATIGVDPEIGTPGHKYGFLPNTVILSGSGTYTGTVFSTGNNISLSQANYDGSLFAGGTVAGTPINRTTEVGCYPANPWGLYDMHGNTYEFCWDRIWNDTPPFGEEYVTYYDYLTARSKAGQPVTDPLGLDRADRRAERGGTYAKEGYRVRSAHRERINPGNNTFPDSGIRVVLPLAGSVWP